MCNRLFLLAERKRGVYSRKSVVRRFINLPSRPRPEKQWMPSKRHLSSVAGRRASPEGKEQREQTRRC
ncbi:hypothetical protein NDU88_000932 [Pleurodeles waltl]|uniref:Uncharacterized protein n=1 Tax=Pleurodeles waltl TaxID=8319 RepID=A0AAV7V9T3_PLEWA|nr:hypothetical protein NDU88_000932 [Pleurodeles waltl]